MQSIFFVISSIRTLSGNFEIYGSNMSQNSCDRGKKRNIPTEM